MRASPRIVRPWRRYAFALAALVGVLAAAPARAATLTWGTSGTGGSGTWDTTATGWWDGSNNVAWNNANNDIAYFGGTAGTVTLNTGITTNGLTFATDGYLITGNTLTLAGSTPTITVNTSLTGTVSSVLAGSAGLTKAGDGLLRLTNANTFTGGAVIRSGTLVVSNASALGSNTITMNDASTGSSNTGMLIDVSGGDYAFSRPIVVANQGTGTVTIGSYANAGTFYATISSPITLQQRDVTLYGAPGGDRTQFTGGISGTGNVTITGGVGGGKLMFDTSANTYSGSTTIAANSRLQLGAGSGASVNMLPDGSTVTVTGTLSFAKGTGSETIDALLGGGVVDALAGADTLVVGSVGGSGTFSGAIKDNGGSLAFTKNGAGTQSLTGTNTYSGATTINAGTLVASSSNALPGYATSAKVVFGGGTLKIPVDGTAWTTTQVGTLLTNATKTSGSLALDIAGSAQTLSTAVSGGIGLVKTGVGTLTLSAANTYSGGTVINQGTVIAGASPTWSVSTFGTGTITINSGATLQANNVHLFGWNAGTYNNFVVNDTGTFAIGANDNYIGSLSLTDNAGITGTGYIGLTAGTVSYTGNSSSKQGTIAAKINLQNPAGTAVTSTFTVNGSNPNGDLVLSGVLQQGGGLTKSGTGILKLTNTNTYTGGTIVNQGTLVVAGPSPFNSSSNLGSGTVTINSGATLQATAVHQFGWNAGSWNNFVVNSGTFAIGANDNYIGSLSLTGNAALTGAGYVGISTGTLNYTGTTASSQATIASKLALVSPQGSVNAILTVNGSNPNGDLVVSGVISGSVLTKSGTGILRLSGNNAQTGNTTISQGTIVAANSNAFGTTGSVTINDGSTGSNNTTLLIGTAGATITINRAISVTGSGSGVTTIGSGTFGSGSDQAIYSGAVTLAKDVTLVSAAGGDRTQFSGGIGGTGNVTIAGANRTVFASAANTYAGSTTISATSTLQLSDGTVTATSFLPDTQVVVVNGILNFAKGSNSETIGGLSGSGVVRELQTNNPTLIVDGGQSQVFSGTIANGNGTMAFTKSGAGTQVLTGSNTYTGATTISGGTLQIGNGGSTGSITSASAVSGSAGAALAFSRSDAVTYSGTYGGAGNLAQLGSGTLTLSGNNSYTGTTSLTAGAVSLGSANAIGTSGTITFGGGTLQYSASNTTDYSNRFSTAGSQAFSIDTNGQAVSLGTALTSSGATLTKLGSGTLTLSANNTYSGNTTVSAGVLRLGNGGAAGSVAGNISVSSGASLAVNRSDASTLSNLVSGAGGLSQVGSGTTTLSNGANSYTGSTTVTGGVLAVSTDLNLGAAPGSATPGSIVIDGATLAFTSGFTLATNRGIALGPATGSGTGTIDVASGQTLTYGGVIADNGAGTDGLVKAGAGALALTGSASYTGDTAVNAGTLQLGAGSSLASPLVTVASGATLSGRGSVNALTVSSGGNLAPGVASSGTLTTGALTFSGAATVTMGVASKLPSNLLNVLGNVTPNGGAGSVVFAFGGNLATIGSGTYSLVTYSGTLTDTSAFGYTGTQGSRQSVAISGTTAANTVSLVVGNSFPVWTGTNTNDWFATNNWLLNPGNAPTDFQVNDTVEFSDAATQASGTVVISGSTAQVASVTFSANTKDYTLSGGFGISGTAAGLGSLIKSGSALLTITNANTYGEGTTLSAGRIRVGDNSALGTGAINVSGSAALSTDGGTARSLANNLHLDADVTLGDATDNGNLTISGTVTFDGQSRTITTPSNVTLSGLVTNGNLTKAGAGILTIAGSNSYGTTTLSAGTLRVGNNAALGGGAVTLNAGTLSSDSTTARTLANSFTIGGDVTLGDATNTGGLALGAGGISLGGATRQITTPSNVTFAGAVASGGITKLGPGTLTLSAANSYAAGTTVSSGSLVLGNVSALGTGNLTFAAPVTVRTTVGGTIANGVVVNAVSGTFDGGGNPVTLSGSVSVAAGGSLTFVPTAAQALTGVVSGAGTIVKLGSGTLSLAGANTLTGTVSLSAGQLNLNSASALGAGSLVIAGGSTLDNTSGTAVSLTGANPQAWNADFTFAGSNLLNLGTGAVTLGADRQVTVTSGTLTVGGSIGGGFALTKAGAGTLSLTGAGNYSGGTTLTAGTLLVGNATALGTGTVALNGGVLNVNGVNAANSVVLGGGTVAGTGGTLSGVISGGSALNVTGAGSITLSASNTYSAGTELLGGTLNVAAMSGIGSGYLAVKNGATFAYTGAGAETTTRTLWLDNGSSTINVTNAAGSLTWNPGAGNRTAPFTKAGPGTLTMGGAFTSGASVTVSDGVLVLTASNSHTGGTTITGGTLQIGAGGTAGSIAGNVAVNSAGSLLFNRSDALSFSGVISGSGAVRQVGTGTTTLGGSNTFTGVLTIAQGAVAVSTANNVSTNGPLGNSASAVVLGSNGFRGTLAYTGATASSSKPFTLATGGTGAFDVGSNVKLTASGLIDGSGALVKVGSGTLTVTTIGTYTGATIVDAGVFELATASYNRGLATSGVTINAGATFLANGMNILYVGSSYIPFTVNSGTLLIGGNTSGNHSHLGPLTLNGGVLTANNPAPYANQYSTLDATITVVGTARSVISGADPAYGYSLVNTGRIFDVGATGDPSGVDLLVSAPFLADGTTGVVKNGVGVMSMTGTNTYSGNTVINAGTYKVSGGGKLYAGGYNDSAVITVNSGGTLELDSYAYDAAGSTGQLSAYSARRILTGGTISVVGSSQSSGNDFQVSNGSTGAFTMTQAGQTLTLTDNPNDTIKIGGRLTFGGAGNITVNEVIQDNTGAGSIVKADAGTLTFGAAMTYTGSTTINSGTFILTGAGQLGSGAYAGAFTNNSAFVSSATANQTFSGVVSGAGSFTKSGAGTLTLSNASNSFTGGVSLSGGVLSFISGGLGSSGTVTLGGGTLRWATGNTQDVSSRLALVSGSTATLDTNGNAVTLASGLGAGTSAALTKAGAGSLALAAAAGYSGATTISGGTLALTGGGSIQSSSGVNLSASGATLDISGASGNRTIAAFEGVAGAAVLLGGNTLTADNATSKSFGGVISGSGGFTKAGGGNLSLTNLQTFTGAARVDAGTLAIGGSNTLATASQIYVASGATLDATAAGLGVVSGQTLGGYGTIAGDVNFLAGSILSPGGSVGSETASSATWNSGFTYLFEVNNASGTAGLSAGGWDLFTVTGTLTLAASQISPITIDLTSLAGVDPGLAANFDPNFNYAWKFAVAGAPISTFNASWFTVDSSGFQNLPGNSERFYVARGDQLSAINASGSNTELYVVYAAVPEPGTLALAGIGLAVAGWTAHRRRRTARRRAA